MGALDRIVEIFKPKQEAAPQAPVQPQAEATQQSSPAVSLEQMKQDAANLEKVLNTPAGSDFRSPATDAQDRQRLEQLNAKIAQAQPPTPEPPPPGIPQIPVAEPIDQPQPEPPPVVAPPEEQKAA